ncbi:MAG: pentapeptide repeat-containing protein [Candidatus Puniceispirillaceae bacterium]
MSRRRRRPCSQQFQPSCPVPPKITSAKFTGAKFIGAKFTGAKFTGATTTLPY